jgi:peptide/nickel transport system substrate-binding protein
VNGQKCSKASTDRVSVNEESTAAVNRPMMGVFNNLVIFKQDVPQNTLRSIVPEPATGWAWNEEGTELTFPLRQGIKWSDGKPFTAADVKCTIDLLQGTGSEKLRISPRENWHSNVEAVTPNGDYEVTPHLKQPRPGRYRRGHATPARRAVASAAGASKNSCRACVHSHAGGVGDGGRAQ